MPAKQLLKERDVRFRLLFEDNPLPMWVFDRQTLQFVEVNHAAREHYGYSREEFLSMSLADIRPEEDVPLLRAELQRRAGALSGSSQRHRLKDGRIIHVDVASHSITYGGRRAVLAVLQDVTQRNQLEEHLRQAAKMEAVGMLAGGIAHDFNNLLTIINGYSEMLLDRMEADDPNRKAIEQIMRAGERAAALTRQLLSFSRRQVMQPKVLDLNQLLGGMESMLRRLIGEDIELRFVPAPEIGRVNADPGQLEQVVMNLVVNARDAMPRGGNITMETADVELDEAYTSTHLTLKPGRYVALTISDSGAGMDAETRAHLFEPFFTTKEQGKGTGLGLTTVFGIVKQSGGAVEIYSESGQGTTVKVYLPRIQEAASAEEPAAPARPAHGTETLLLVEDEDIVRNLVRDTLRQAGYRVLDAASPADARRICANYPGPIHLLVTDLVMPKESGRDLAESLIPQRPEMRVLFMSGYTGEAVIDKGLLNRDVAFLQKPFTPAALSSAVRAILEKDGKINRAG
jgi:PAS domain S-box-containing protein